MSLFHFAFRGALGALLIARVAAVLILFSLVLVYLLKPRARSEPHRPVDEPAWRPDPARVRQIQHELETTTKARAVRR